VPATGTGLTVTGAEAVALPQLGVNPLVSVKLMLALPADTPDTVPLVPTVATEVLLLLHAPVPLAAPASVYSVLEPAHTFGPPLTVPATGNALTVTTAELIALPQLGVNPLVTV
jgi:hypothetical protein